VQVSLTASGTVGSLEVKLAVHQLRQPVTQEPAVSAAYPYKFVRAALTGVAGLKAELATHVAIDANGMLKVRVAPRASSAHVQGLWLEACDVTSC
jgi:hypothetical protein